MRADQRPDMRVGNFGNENVGVGGQQENESNGGCGSHAKCPANRATPERTPARWEGDDVCSCLRGDRIKDARTNFLICAKIRELAAYRLSRSAEMIEKVPTFDAC